jgi:Tol biopolymer transport system component
VFVRDLVTHQTVLVSVTSTGQQANGTSSHPVLSADGRYVAFQSRATNLAPGDVNGGSDVFLHDILTGRTSLVSISLTGTPGNSYSLRPSISDDGHLIAFDSAASDLVPGDLNGKRDVFVRNTITHSTMRVSTDHGVELQADSYISDLSPDGGFIAFGSDAAIPVGSSSSGSAVANPGPTHAYLVDLESGDWRNLGNFKALDSVAVGTGAHVVAVSSREKTGVIEVFLGSRVTSFDRTGFAISLTNDGRFISFTGGPGSDVAEGVIDWARSRLAIAVAKW